MLGRAFPHLVLRLVLSTATVAGRVPAACRTRLQRDSRCPAVAGNWCTMHHSLQVAAFERAIIIIKLPN
jgi:hypothetical protein